MQNTNVVTNEDFKSLIRLLPANIIENLNVLKQRELQIEFLNSSGSISIAADSKSILTQKTLEEWSLCPQDIADLLMSLNQTIKNLTSLIPNEFMEIFNSTEWDSYLEYTKYEYGKILWNEIPLPKLTKEFFNILISMINKLSDSSENQTQIVLIVHDMSNSEIPFNTLEQAETFISRVSCAPCSVFNKISNENSSFEYTEIYSF